MFDFLHENGAFWCIWNQMGLQRYVISGLLLLFIHAGYIATDVGYRRSVTSAL